MYRRNFALLLVYSTLVTVLSDEWNDNDSCFCQLKGEIDDCSCNVETLDSFNNLKIFPRLNSLLEKDYFKFYKANMMKKCPFDSDNSGKCGSKSCAIAECPDDQIPAGLKKNESKNKYTKEANMPGDKEGAPSQCEPAKKEKNELGELDTEISAEDKENFKKWKTHDDSQDNFCEPEDEDSPDALYYDLVRNPERFTGYAGPSAVNVWKLIYDQNCFKPNSKDFQSYVGLQKDSGNEGLCLEQRVFFRMISGFHTSINVDVTANWLIPGRTPLDPPGWGPNLEEFRKRFDPDKTWGEGPKRLKNLYFTYLVELRALAKAAPYLEQELYYTGNEKEDAEVRLVVRDLLESIKKFPRHFDESKLFQGDASILKETFKTHFRNISSIMDCVGCDKCRLWGKLQIVGMGTALKILFSGDSMGPQSIVTQEHKKADIPFQLQRGEIVSLLNGFGRLSKSIHELETFRRMLQS